VDFELDEGHAFLKQTVQDFAEKEISPIADVMDREETFPAELLGRLAHLGYSGVGVPQEYGGTFTDYLSVVIMGEELARVSASVPVALFPHAILCAHNIYRYGTDVQRKRYLADLAQGKKWGAMALTEVSAGSDALSLRTTAGKAENGFVLNGSKTFITNVPFADVYLIYAKTALRKGPESISGFIVEKGTRGFSMGRNFEKMGLRGSPTGEIFFDSCPVPSENLLGGEEGRGFKNLIKGLDVERVSWSSIALGIAQASFESALSYAQEREQFEKPIIEFQMVQQMISEMAVSVEAARLLVYKTAGLLDTGKRARFEASSAKLFSTETAVKVSGDALQIFGGAGYTKDYPVERYFRDAKILTVAAGSSEVQRMIIVHELKRK
jgi:butyryl-CoA dehydrogenase